MNARPIVLRGKPISGGTVPLICTPLVGRTPDAVKNEVAAILPKRPDVLEWRVDYFQEIGNVATVIDTAQAIKRVAGDIPVLFTRRSTIEGGEKIAISEARVLEMYAEVCAARCIDLIDYELANAPENVQRVRTVSREYDVAMVASYHNFQGTPPAAELVAKLVEAEQLGADVGKVAVMPKNPDDVLTLLNATLQASRATSLPLITMSMGGYGSVSRMVGVVFGSSLTFAVGQNPSAPGQIAIEELRNVLATVRRAVGGA
ncbi:MAG TPA: type I 3-dehydroquinate dehydratase [Casimicrobiaceae bacterium]|nr:type I 3-dehydroquinate dehydratase [Casimicrobiaceae bacterium]